MEHTVSDCLSPLQKEFIFDKNFFSKIFVTEEYVWQDEVPRLLMDLGQ